MKKQVLTTGQAPQHSTNKSEFETQDIGNSYLAYPVVDVIFAHDTKLIKNKARR